MTGKNLGKIFLGFTIIAAIFSGISFWLLDNIVCTVIGLIFFIFNALATLCIDKKYKDTIIKLLDIF